MESASGPLHASKCGDKASLIQKAEKRGGVSHASL